MFAGTQSFIIDPDYSTYQSTASWRVETLWSVSCTPTKSFNSSSSNKFSNLFVNINNESSPTDFVTVYPNPFSGSTLISYSLENSSSVNVVIYNEMGQIVETLVSADQQAGQYQYEFNAARNDNNAGIYFVKIMVDEKIFMKKIVLID